MAPVMSKLQKVGLSLALLSAIDETKEKKKRIWMKRWLKERAILSHSNFLELLDFKEIHNFLRMDMETFSELLRMVKPYIIKADTNMRTAVSAEERLLATLRYLSTGRDYRDLRFSTVISHQLLSEIIPETCRAIYKVLKPHIKMPSCEQEWKDCAKLFETQWQFQNCVGCMDGKHILINKPPGSGSLYYNYKGTFSVVLFAVVNANYEFIYVNTGSNGSMSDGGIIKNTKFYEKLRKNELGLPESCILPGTEISVPYVFLGDSAFALDKHVMKPFPERNISKEKKIFNYRLCRARRIVENAFGIIASRFRVFRHPMNLKLEHVDAVVLASCALHNFLRTKSKSYMVPMNHCCEDMEPSNNGNQRQRIEELTPLERNSERPSNDGKHIRNVLTEYFNGVGSVSFQDRMAKIRSD